LDLTFDTTAYSSKVILQAANNFSGLCVRNVLLCIKLKWSITPLVSEYLKHIGNVTCVSLTLYNLHQKLKIQSNSTIYTYHPSKSSFSLISGLIDNLLMSKVDTDIPESVF